MAEEKKDDKKPAEFGDDAKKDKKDSGAPDEWWLSTGFLVTVVVIIMVFLSRLRAGAFTVESLISLIPERIINTVRHLVLSYIFFATMLSIFLLIGLVYSLIRLIQVEREWWNKLYPLPAQPEVNVKRNTKWDRVLEHVGSSNPSDWRLSILEADIILDELLDHLGYIGDTIGDKLKKVSRGDMETLDKAWEAHKIRNAIAHEGQDFQLSQREAQRVIGLFQSVFQEFDYI